MIMFPVLILLYLWWKRGRLGWNDLLSSAPFFAVSLAIGLVTVWFLNHHARAELIVLGGPLSRLACAGLAISFYLWKSILPFGLMTIYPMWKIDPPTPEQFLPWPILAALAWWLWTQRRGWGRHVILGLSFFLINLTPFLGLNAAAYMGFTWVMDHVLYLPIIGLIGLTVAGLDLLRARLSPATRPVGIGLVAVMVVLLAWSSHNYAGLYINLETLWGYTVQENPDAFLARNNLGFALAAKGRLDEAMDQFREALRINPRFPDAHANLGLMLQKSGRIPEAIAEFEIALAVDPAMAGTHYNLGVALAQSRRNAEAMEQYRQTLALDPGYINAYNNLGAELAEANRIPEAIEVFQAALRVAPDSPIIRNNLLSLQSAPKAVPAKK
jgi:Tfp pilus assembly protein PilF